MYVMVELHEDEKEKRLKRFHKQESEHLAQHAAEQLEEAGYVDLTQTSVNTDALRLIDENVARKAELAAFGKVGDDVRIAAKNPKSSDVQSVVSNLKRRGFSPKLFVTSQPSLERAWKYYADISLTEKSTKGEVEIVGKHVKQFLDKNSTRKEAISFVKESMMESSENSDTSDLVEVLIAAAVAIDASDIHVEIDETGAYIRMRIDGVLHKISEIPKTPYERIVSRLKLLSGMKLNITDKAQDGRFSIRMKDTEVEIRSSVVPGNYGESVVMRVLNQETINVDIESLGMQPRFLRLMREEINRPNGLILNTGPTGSGKTTTLYSFLKEINSPQLKTVTIENPIEYHLKGVVQTQVDPDEGYDFFDGLKAAVRQDPDIMMVGEIRDKNTAETALHSGLTGHLVLSTLHTNDAAGTFPRLAELGVKNNLIDSAMNVAMAQRLVRTLCDNCKQEIPIEGKDKETIDALTQHIPRPDDYRKELNQDVMYKPTGCEQCANTGYKGRTGVFEAIIVDGKVGDMVRKNPGDRGIWAYAQKEQEMLSMAQDGVIKILRGKTSLDELQRVVDIKKTITNSQKIDEYLS
jgi:type II secretory ATPase GspE/PulE/Tfp pilus assembly ATPase PilB-like protein